MHATIDVVNAATDMISASIVISIIIMYNIGRREAIASFYVLICVSVWQLTSLLMRLVDLLSKLLAEALFLYYPCNSLPSTFTLYH
jgi:hypothetical protein